ncbi:MAG: aldo/keto reductase [Erysipelotrichaceae bacterium]|nr:aldo/keto reductase [Erysipelotrichaceae bacterium]
METRKIGNLTVSEIGMGCMGFSHGYGKVPSEDYAIEAIRNAYQAGCTFFDTAETYGQEQFYKGHNEKLVGKAVAPFRNKIVLATKLHIETSELDNNDLETVIRNHLKKSMERLKTNYIDLYYLHRINQDIAIEEIAIVMGKLINENLIKGWGLSQVDVKMLKRAHDITPVTAVQNLYSMLERDCEDEIFPYCLENNIGVVAFSPIASGFLSGKVTTETKFEGDDVRKFVPQLSKENIIANQPILDILNKFAVMKNATNAQISLAWMLHKYPNVIPIPGSKNKERIMENLNASHVNLTDQEFNQLEETLRNYKVYGHRGINESQQNSFGQNWRKKS